MAHEIVFSHPSESLLHNRLVVGIKPDQIVFSYGLNTANYPTYGGEVIQILSCFIEDMTITGATKSYAQLERIYKFFIDYMQIATQGKGGHGSFDPRPMEMFYPERGWHFEIHPKTAPTFRYGRDVVVPQWTIQAAIADPAQADPDFMARIMSKAQLNAVRSNGEIRLFGKVTGDIGYEAEDPFRTPFVDGKTKDQIKVFRDLGDTFSRLIPAWMQGDFGDLSQEFSRPAIGQAEISQGNK